MNRVFRTKWSAAHQTYVVTDEHHAAKGKAGKSAVALAVSALLLAVAGSASAAFVQPNHDYDNVDWRKDAEFMKDWGLRAMNSDHAYKLGFHGQGVTLGIVDSGTLLTHSQLDGQLIDTAITGKYGSTGNRYQQWSGLNWGSEHENQFGSYEKDQSFDRESSNWVAYVNDSHGTHVAGTIVAKRDGTEFHGVSFGSKLVVGNTGGTDNSTYGPILNNRDPKNPQYTVLDYNYFKAVYESVAESGAKFINNSWGTNTRVCNGKDPNWDNEDKNKDGKPDGHNYDNFNVNQEWVVNSNTNTPEGFVGEWWAYKQAAKLQSTKGENGEDLAFIDAAGEVALKHNIVQVFTTGNRNGDNPYVRAGYAHFKPEFERHWVAVAGAKYIDEELYYISNFNDAGYGKWWTVAAPGNAIYSSAVVDDAYVTPGKGEGAGKELGDETFAAWGGTSMAAPHVTGALGVLASRYPYMEPGQVRDVMFTTANQNIKFEVKKKNADGKLVDNADGIHDQEKYNNHFVAGVPDVNFGWGVPDLKKGMYGPGQLLGKTDINLGNYSDIWTNDISQIAWDARRIEDQAELKKIAEAKNALTREADTTKKEALEAYYKIREDELKKRLEGTAEGYQDWYVGKLTVAGEKGSGATLLLTGNNTFRGGVEVKEGATVMGFAESFGSYDPKYFQFGSTISGDGIKKAGEQAVAYNEQLKKLAGRLTINENGRGGVLAYAYDEVTDKGTIQSNKQAQHGTEVFVKKGGTLLVHAGSVNEKSPTTTNIVVVSAEEGSLVSGWAQGKDLAKIYDEGKLFGTLTVTNGSLANLKAGEDDMLFFNATTKIDKNTVTTEIVRDETKTFGMFAKNANQKAVAAGLEQKKGALFETLLSGNQTMFEGALDALDNDLLLTSQNAAVVNTMDVTKAVKDQALRRGEGNAVELEHGAHLWATGIGAWGTAENTSDVDVDFYAGLFGADYQFGNTTLGLFFGAGTTDFKGGADGKLDSDDIHLGLYGKTDVADVASISYGVTHTMQSREGHRTANFANTVGYNKIDSDAKITQFYVEGAYTGLSFQNGASVEPYVGFSYIHATADGVSDKLGNMTYTTDIKDQNLQVSTLGVRGQVPFTAGTAKVALKGDLAWNHFYGDTVAQGRLGGVAAGVIEGAELSDMVSVGLGIEATVGKSTTFGLSYTGNFDSDVKSNGISANIRYAF